MPEEMNMANNIVVLINSMKHGNGKNSSPLLDILTEASKMGFKLKIMRLHLEFTI
tara:strand:- start:225 stop:389 length:165 start_codon:yes stop_codon:yes gene_type:complete